MDTAYNRYSCRKYKIIFSKTDGQYAAKFEDNDSLFWLNADNRKEAIDEAEGYDAEGLFNIGE